MRRNQTCKDQDNTEVFKEHKEGVEFGVLSTKERQGFDRRIKGGRMGLIRPSRLSWAVLRRYILRRTTQVAEKIVRLASHHC